MESLAWFVVLVAAVAGAVVGWWFGRVSGSRPYDEALETLRRGIEVGDLGDASGPSPVRALRSTVGERWVPRGVERESAYRDALTGITRYLKESVESPLEEASEGNTMQMKDGIDEAVGALQDLEFYAHAPPVGSDRVNLSGVVREVAAEFADDSGVDVRTRGVRSGIHVRGNEEALKDALFLIFHNAGQFGRGKPVDVRLRTVDGGARLDIRDRGPGFTADALSRAYDPFYSTLPGGLGMGLTHARQVLEAMGARIHLRNSEKGGAEVEIGFDVA